MMLPVDGTGGDAVTDDPRGEDTRHMIETLWDGRDTWVRRVIEIAISPNPDGDVVLTLPPQSLMGVGADGSRDVAIPLALVRWLVDRIEQDGGQAEDAST
jgi:hypothetical protein